MNITEARSSEEQGSYVLDVTFALTGTHGWNANESTMAGYAVEYGG